MEDVLEPRFDDAVFVCAFRDSVIVRDADGKLWKISEFSDVAVPMCFSRKKES